MNKAMPRKDPWRLLPVAFVLMVAVGVIAFVIELTGDHPGRAWQAFLINFLVWSAIAQGALLFSAVMHITRSRWSRPMQNLAESFAFFFPLSLLLFPILFLGRDHLFPWLHMDLGGKAVWLNLPFLFWRDLAGLLILYGLGTTYLYYALRLKLNGDAGRLRRLIRPETQDEQKEEECRERMTVLSGLYILAYALVLTVLSYDLVMSMEPHWYSTLFGPYTFIKAFYIGLASLMILASLLHVAFQETSAFSFRHFHDLGKLLFAFCLLWADFFYVQLLVIWYGNISEETSYVIRRTVLMPWKPVAWAVFIVAFVTPFFILLNRKVKGKPLVMIPLCTVVLAAIWFEHLLLLGPALSPRVTSLPLGIGDGGITLGFFGLMALSITFFLRLFPEFLPRAAGGDA